MRFAREEFWAELRPVWRYSDQLAVARAIAEGDELAGDEMMVLRAVDSWSAGEITQEVLGELSAFIVVDLKDFIVRSYTAELGDPKAPPSSSSSSTRSRAKAPSRTDG